MLVLPLMPKPEEWLGHHFYASRLMRSHVEMTDATNPIHNPDSVVGRNASILALQLWLGVLPKRRNRANPIDRPSSCPVGPNLGAAGGADCSKLSGR
jgi:hypothetical protein